jgi:hypothetical protein
MRTLLSIFILLVISFITFSFARAADVQVTAIVPGCGDGIVSTGEQCDGANLNGASCATVGFSSGTLSCSTLCTFVTDACVLEENDGERSGSSRRTSHFTESRSSMSDIYTALQDVLVELLAVIRMLEQPVLVIDDNGQNTDTISNSLPDSSDGSLSSSTIDTGQEGSLATIASNTSVDSSGSFPMRTVLISVGVLLILIVIRFLLLRKGI